MGVSRYKVGVLLATLLVLLAAMVALWGLSLPLRDASFADLLTNATGAALGGLLALALSRTPRARIEANDLDVRMQALDENYQGASAAADVEQSVTGADRGLIKERLSGRIPAE